MSQTDEKQKTTKISNDNYKEYLKNIYYDPANPASFSGPNKLQCI